MIQTKLPFKEETDSEKSFRTLHYLGGKSRIIKPLKEIIKSIDSNKGLCDLFAGSGAVSQAFSNERRVVANDIQEYSRVICSALLNPLLSGDIDNGSSSMDLLNQDVLKCGLIKFDSLIRLEEKLLVKQEYSTEEVAQFIEGCSIYKWLNNEIPVDLFPALKSGMNEALQSFSESDENEFLITKYFGGIFFSFKQSCYLDAIHAKIRTLDTCQYDTHLAALLTCVSNIVNTVGKQFAQPINPRSKSGIPKKNLVNSLNKDRNLDVLEYYVKALNNYANKSNIKAFKHHAIRKDFREAIKNLDNEIKFVYADPPYTRDHYSRFYHVLETICLNDYPTVSTNKTNGIVSFSKGIYRKERHQSEFCIRSQASKAFTDLFQLCSENDKILILSYSPYDEKKGAHPRVVTLEFLKNTAKEYFENVKIVSAGKFKHSKLNKTDFHLSSGDEAEIFIVCKNF